jgi:N-methylhydantoinase B/oxoprolinase/acetone carboxylase alpha subunit
LIGWGGWKGDVAIVNDPFAGGTHLPDITLFPGHA